MMRYIRLKEWGSSEDCYKRPEDKYIAGTDGSLISADYRLRTDENGFIRSGRENLDGAANVVVLGDSVPENLFVHEDRRMCAVLESLLTQSGNAVNVLNGGMSGATTLHLLTSFLTKIIPLKPRVVLVMSGIIDIDATLSKGLFWSKNNYITPIVPEDKNHRPEYIPCMNMTARLKLLQSLSAVAKIHDIPLMFVTVPHRANPEDNYIVRKYKDILYFNQKVEERNAINAQTREHCKKTASPLIDLEIELRKAKNIFYDDFHMNENGSTVIAKIIHREISKVFL